MSICVVNAESVLNFFVQFPKPIHQFYVKYARVVKPLERYPCFLPKVVQELLLVEITVGAQVVPVVLVQPVVAINYGYQCS